MGATAKSIVITGGNSGIGAALAKMFADDGHNVFICARRRDRLAQVAEGRPSISYAVCDVSSEPQVKSFFDEVRARMGSVDVLIHCAAIMGPVGPTIEVDSQAWLVALKTNLFGALLAIKHAVPLMPAERRPRVLLLSGGGAFDPMPHLSAYGASKAGIIRLAETMAVELAPRNIAVNVFAPGFVATEIFEDMMKSGPEIGGPIYDTVVRLFDSWSESDIQVPLDCARFLISEASSPLTGKTISARFDPWYKTEFVQLLPEICASRLYTTQRTVPTHLKGWSVADQLDDQMLTAKSGSK